MTFFSAKVMEGHHRLPKKAAGKVCASLSWEDAAYTLIVDDYEAELNLQDIFKYCLEQEISEG